MPLPLLFSFKFARPFPARVLRAGALFAVGAFFFSALLAAWSADESLNKRLAVLEFQDSSGFDSPRGCGCIPMGPFERLFGRTRGARERWNLAAGFRDMLTTTLENAYGYEPIAPEELNAALAELKLNPKDLKKEEARKRLATHLGADALLTGKIEMFKQDRTRGAAGGQMASGGALSASSKVGIGAAHHRASARLHFTAYGPEGGELLSAPISETATYSIGSAQTGPLSTSLDNKGASTRIGSQEAADPKRLPPIVDHRILNKVKFGVKGWDAPEKPGKPPNYRRTLLGVVTAKTLNSAVAHLRERIGPALPEETAEEPARSALIGKIAFVQEKEIYINLGGKHNVNAGDMFRVFREGEPVLDPDTGEKIGAVEKLIGTIRVEETMRPAMSRAVLVSGEALRGDIVRLELKLDKEKMNGEATCGD